MDKLALIDSQPLTRISISQQLGQSLQEKRRSEDFIIVPFSSPEELLDNYSQECESEEPLRLIVFNIGAAHPSDSKIQKSIVHLKRELPSIPLIILSAHEERHCILNALRYGAHSYILTAFDPSIVTQALRLILMGGRFIPANLLVDSLEEKEEKGEENFFSHEENQNPPNGSPLNSTIDATILANFTPRQLEVLQLLRKGKSNKIIAYELKMQESTVKVHVRQIMKRLNAINRTHAAFLAAKMGIMEPDTNLQLNKY
jgi:DNA-binding NarL/FixJ family response regulator